VSVLEIHNVTKRFGNLVAVCDVSLNVAKGELRAIIGPNGAGKTTSSI
jgi:branched-chain amino acid transport system ATP-binding protein